MRVWLTVACALVVAGDAGAGRSAHPASARLQSQSGEYPSRAGDDYLTRAPDAERRKDSAPTAGELAEACHRFALSDVMRAADACDRAIAAARDADDVETEAEALSARSLVHSWSTRFDEGVADGLLALELVGSRSGKRAFRLAHWALGAAYRERGDVGPALLHLGTAIDEAEAAGDAYVESLSRSLRARTLFWIGDFETARGEAERARLLAQSIRRPDVEFFAAWQLGMTELEADRVAIAVPHLEEALRLALLVRNDAGAAMMEVDLADAHVQLGNLARAEFHLTAAERLIDAGRTPPLWTPYVQEIRGRISLARRDHAAAAEAFARAAEGASSAWLQVRALLGQARSLRRGGDPAAARGVYERAIAIVEASRSAIVADIHRASFLGTNGAPYRELIALLSRMPGAAAAADAFAISEAGRSRALLDAVHAARAEERATARPQPLGEVQASLGPDEGLIQYVQAEERLFAFTVWRGGLRWAEIADERQTVDISAQVRFFRTLIRQGAAPAALRASGSALYEKLLAPALPPVSGVTTLFISPDGFLNHLPFDGLVVRSAQEEPPQFVAERYVVVYTPSASLLVDGRTSAPEPGRRVLVVADPAPIVAGTLVGRSAKLLPLPHGRREARMAFQSMGSDGQYLQGAAATESAVKALALDQFGVLHFATHAVVDHSSPLRSALALGAGGGEDGWLEAGEVYALALSPGLVVLSGCQTSEGRVLSGEGVLSLARAFIYAGARTVVATFWDIDDQYSAVLMRHFYGSLATGVSPGEALSYARRTAIAAGMPVRVWAAFAPIGRGGGPLAAGHRPGAGRATLAALFMLVALAAASIAIVAGRRQPSSR